MPPKPAPGRPDPTAETLAGYRDVISRTLEAIKFQRTLLAENEQRLFDLEMLLAESRRRADEFTDAQLDEFLDTIAKRYENVLRKLNTNNKDINATIRQVRQEAGRYTTLAHDGYEEADAATLARVLNRHKYLADNQQLPPRLERYSGISGQSRVYLVVVREPGSTVGGRRFIAKFDRADRAEKEWAKIESLRAENLPPGISWPENAATVRTDGVILYPPVGSMAESDNVVDLGQYLAQRLAKHDECGSCLKEVLQILSGFHGTAPGHKAEVSPVRRATRVTWADVFHPAAEAPATKLLSPVDLRALAVKAWPGPVWSADEVELEPGRKAPNPLGAELTRRLTDPIPAQRLSRVHGDLHLGNVLVCLNGDYSRAGVYVIDLGSTERDRLTALDLARLECEIWAAGVHATGSSANAMAELIAARDWLDGRKDGDSPNPAARVVKTLRQHAHKILGEGQRTYCLEDYFRCLYFLPLACLEYPNVQNDKDIGCRHLATAALALETLSDIRRGEYGGDKPTLRFPFRPE